MARALVAASVWAGLAADAAAIQRTIELGDLRIAFDSDWVGAAAPGYLPVRIDVTNVGAPRVIEIVAEGSRFGRTMVMSPRRAPTLNRGRSSVRRELRMARGARVRFTFPIPISGETENITLSVREGGRSLQGFGSVSTVGGRSPLDASIAIVAEPGTPFIQAASSWLRSPAPASPPHPPHSPSAVYVTPTPVGPPLHAVFEPARLPDSWLGYTSLRAVAIRPDE